MESSAKRILVVDDNKMSRKVNLYRLEQMGFATVTAASGKEAFEVLQVDHVDLILLDVLMDEMDGLEVLKRLHVDDRYREIPVVMVSGVEDPDVIEDCLTAGASDFLNKPVKAEVIQEIVTDLLGSPRDDGEIAEAHILALSEMPVIDLSYVEQLKEDYGAETTLNLVERFEELARVQHDIIIKNSDDIKGCHRVSSGLKASARSLGLSRLAGACRNIERACSQFDKDKLAEAVTQLETCFEETSRDLREHKLSPP